MPKLNIASIAAERFYWAYPQHADTTGASGLGVYEQQPNGFLTYDVARTSAAGFDDFTPDAVGPAIFCLSSGMWRNPETTEYSPFMPLDGRLPHGCIVRGSDILAAAGENQVSF